MLVAVRAPPLNYYFSIRLWTAVLRGNTKQFRTFHLEAIIKVALSVPAPGARGFSQQTSKLNQKNRRKCITWTRTRRVPLLGNLPMHIVWKPFNSLRKRHRQSKYKQTSDRCKSPPKIIMVVTCFNGQSMNINNKQTRNVECWYNCFDLHKKVVNSA